MNTGSRRIFALYLAATAAAASPWIAARSSAQPAAAAPTQAQTDAAAAMSNDTPQLAAILVDPNAQPTAREEAARRLVARHSPEANRALLAALSDQNPAGQFAVAQALSETGDPLPDFITPLFASLGTNDRVTDKATAALVNYRDNESVLTRLIETATSRQRGSSEMVRGYAIRSLGSFSEKRSAAALIATLRNPEESKSLRDRAADALAAMTGIGEYGQDVTSWSNWWDAESKSTDVDFRNKMLQRVAGQYSRQQAHVARLSSELQSMVQEFYRAAPAADKERLLKRFLMSNEPETRVAAVKQVTDDALDGKPIPPEVAALMRALIGDSNPDVRRAVAIAIKNTNDKPALDLLLTQATLETNPLVRADIAAALGPMGDLKAVPVLLHLLDDDSHQVAKNAAQSIRTLGGKIHDSSATLASQVAARLKALIDRTANSPGDVDVRVAAVAALVPLKDKSLNAYFYGLLNPSVDPAIRRSALSALGALEDPQSAGAIVNCLNDPDPTVVLAAIVALGQVSPPPEMLNPLRPLLDPQQQRDPSIRSASWDVVRGNLPLLSKEQLTQWGEFFRGINDRTHRVDVLKVLVERLSQSKELDALATVQQQIADEYIAQGDAASAVPYYKVALDNRKSQNVGGPMMLNLMKRLLNALLVSGKYAEATANASDWLQADAGNQELVGDAILGQLATLVQSGSADDLRKAQTLIDSASKMRNPLAGKYLNQLEPMRKSVEQQLQQASQPPATGPRSAVETVAVEWFDQTFFA